jgi:hypothetical protein
MSQYRGVISYNSTYTIITDLFATILLLFTLPFLSNGACSQSPFPKMIGGSTDTTTLWQVEYFQNYDSGGSLQYLVGIGNTQDNALANDGSTCSCQRPMVIAY